jgi:hypothetical protein
VATSIRPHTSKDEFNFFRGVACELQIKNFLLTPFISLRKLDATMGGALSNSDTVISIQSTGNHRTISEFSKRNQLEEKYLGVNVRYIHRYLQIGVTGVRQSYNKVFFKPYIPYNQFDFRGKSLTSLSVDYNVMFQNFNFFGEVSRVDYTNDSAQLHGLLLSVDKYADFAIACRNYGKEYHTFHNNGIGEGGKTQNETGVYLGLKLKPLPSILMHGYVDYFSFPWLKFNISSPSQGFEYLMQISYALAKKSEFYVRFLEREKMENRHTLESHVIQVRNLRQRNLRVNYNCQLDPFFVLKTRLEGVQLKREGLKNETGFFMAQEVRYTFANNRVDVTVSFAVFDTDSYASRIYAFESNPTALFLIPVFYLQGSRSFVMFHLHLHRNFSFWMRWSTTVYSQAKGIGTGSEHIKGNRKSTLTLQMRVNF